jgi:RNA polymerase sigma factor for flagellar operon FliA
VYAQQPVVDRQPPGHTMTAPALAVTGNRASATVPQLWEHYRATADEETRAILLAQYVKLVHFVARRIAARTPAVEYEDLVGVGSIGLLNAFRGYDASRGLAFSTYAVQRINGAILDDLRRRDWLPRSSRARSRRMFAARTALESRLQRSPTPVEVANELGLELAAYWRWCDELEQTRPGGLPDGDAVERLDQRRSDFATPADQPADERLVQEERTAELRAAIATLPERERQVLALCYFEELGLKQIGASLGITESRVCQIRQRALQRLRETMGVRRAG